MEHTSTVFDTLSNDSRLWIYTADRFLSEEEVARARERISDFTRSWVSHDRQLKAVGDILYDRFLILMVDESTSGASGCSIDASVHFLKSLGADLNIDWFDRMQFSYFDDQGKLQVSGRDEFEQLYKQGRIGPETIVLDNLVDKKSGWLNSWKKPLSASWHLRLVG